MDKTLPGQFNRRCIRFHPLESAIYPGKGWGLRGDGESAPVLQKRVRLRLAWVICGGPTDRSRPGPISRSISRARSDTPAVLDDWVRVQAVSV